MGHGGRKGSERERTRSAKTEGVEEGKEGAYETKVNPLIKLAGERAEVIVKNGAQTLVCLLFR